MENPPIGLVGVGLLGTALAERMLAAGLPVLGSDLDASRLARLKELGGAAASRAADIASACDRIVLCLPHSGIVRSVIADLNQSLRPGAVIVDATTGDPDDAERTASDLAAQGRAYVDATIAGSSEQVRRGEATVLIGGADSAVGVVHPILASWGAKRFHVGPAGSGARMKLVVNLVLGLNRAVLAEGLNLAEACGIEPAQALKVLQATPAFSACMPAKGPKMLSRDYSPQARLAQHCKDVGLIRSLAARSQAPTPLSDVHEDLLRRAMELGYGDGDNSAVIEAFRQPLRSA